MAEKHGGLTEAENLALACTLCNKHKGSDLTSIDPETGDIVPLYHPRKDQWREHFKIKDALLYCFEFKSSRNN
ncbi:HNH endonuclease [Calothrix sp. CCY 0018]|uniref:HNH endonuclease n=1 Tax=Calothrix sp. CCY 0018 TaxID=3103864 RepID=UPI0039C6EEA3